MSGTGRGADWTPQRPRGSGTPRRKRVVLADRRRTRQVGRTIMELEEQTSVGEVLVRHLVKVQLRSALLLGGATVLLFASMPLVFWLVPEVGAMSVLGIRLPWLLLGVLAYTAIALTAWVCVWAAERTERDFAELVRRR